MKLSDTVRWPDPAPQTTWSFRGARNRACAARAAPEPEAAPAGFDPRLESGSSVNAQHHRPGRWIHIQAHDVADLVDEQRVGRELEGLATVRLQAEGSPDPTHRALRDVQLFAEQSRAPVMASRGRSLSVVAINCSIFASPCLRGAPGRGSSSRPSSRRSKNRLRHLPTVCVVTCSASRPRCCWRLGHTRGRCANAMPSLRGLMPPRPFDQSIVLLHRQLQSRSRGPLSIVRSPCAHTIVRLRHEQTIH